MPNAKPAARDQPNSSLPPHVMAKTETASTLIGAAESARMIEMRHAAFDRVLTGHFYGHLPDDGRETFLCEARRVGAEIVVVDSALRPGVTAEQWQARVLNDGSQHQPFKHYLTVGSSCAFRGHENSRSLLRVAEAEKGLRSCDTPLI